MDDKRLSMAYGEGVNEQWITVAEQRPKQLRMTKYGQIKMAEKIFETTILCTRLKTMKTAQVLN